MNKRKQTLKKGNKDENFGKKLLIVLALSVFILAGCQSSAMEPQKETSKMGFEELDMTPSGVRVPEYNY